VALQALADEAEFVGRNWLVDKGTIGLLAKG